MDQPLGLTCDHENCGRSFPTPGALGYHKRSCRPSKKRLQTALSRAKELWETKKRARITPAAPEDCLENLLGSHQDENIRTLPQAGPEVEVLRPQNTLEKIASRDPNLDLPLAKRRGRRATRMPKKFRDNMPQAQPSATILYAPMPPAASCSKSTPATDDAMHTSPTLVSRVLRYFRTPRNVFGLSRKHYGMERPLHDPEDYVTPQDLCEINADTVPLVDGPSGGQSFYPYPNQSSFSLGDWYWNQGIQKSQEGFRKLIDIVGDQDFAAADIRSTNWTKINATLAENADGDHSQHDSVHRWLGEDTGWKRTAISISVPFHHRMAIPGSRSYLAGDLYHRSIVSVIRERVTNDDKHFHYEPYELLWKSGDEAEEIRVHGELYTSAAFLSEHEKLLQSPAEPGCDAPRAIVALMFWSDETHLTSFGNAKLWPCYMFFGNDSKYRRAKPSCHLCNHVAYFQTLPESFKQFAVEYTGGKGPNRVLMAHCHREIFHEQWKILLDDEFLEAYEHGILIQCCDGITRRLYPRIFTYSADHPEKTLISSIRKGGKCPCPRCSVPKAELSQFGTPGDRIQRQSLARMDSKDKRRDVDMARRKIYKDKFSVTCKAVENVLKPESWVPTSNAFSTRLARFDFNLYPMLVVDLMHEFEQGVWKNLFTHLVRMLHALDPALVIEMDKRYRQVSRFGSDVIRKFSSNSSEQKKMAARDFEDLLQCAIPVFDGLFPDSHNDTIQELLFTCAHWHGLAKLRMHTDYTLQILEEITTKLGDQLRFFANETCLAYSTVELPRETAARLRRKAKNAQVIAPNTEETSGGTRRKKTFNMNTYKHHALGDYVQAIRTYGTCDSYSTEAGELEHRTAKSRYSRTDRREFIKQMTQIERREARIRRIRTRNLSEGKSSANLEEVAVNPEVHHSIGKTEASPEHIGLFVMNCNGDPSVKNFIPKLKKHLLPRIRSLLGKDGTSGMTEDGFLPGLPSTSSHDNSPGSADWQAVIFQNDRMYEHKIMHINYTSYDVRRDQDIVYIGTRGQCNNVMVLAPEPARLYGHPFWYARVLGIYHTNVIYIGEGNADFLPRRLEFLWVRWYEMEDQLETSQLARISFPPSSDDHSFGFLDPNDVLRACHVIPLFRLGLACKNGPGLSSCGQDHDHTDWESYIANRFVDRDMVMRYHWGHGVGHTYSHQSQKIRETDNADLEGSTRETEVRQENLPQTNWSGPQAEGNVTGHPNEEKNGDEEAGDNDDESDTESYDDYDSEDDDYNYCDADDVSGESDEISDDNIE